MRTALWPLQVSLFNRLKNDTALTARAKVYDSVSESAAMPYVTVGEDTSVDNGNKSYDGEIITHTLHVWSSYNGRKEVKELMNTVLQSVTSKPLSLEGGFFVEDTRLDLMQVLDVNGSPAKHGVIRFRFKITHEEAKV